MPNSRVEHRVSGASAATDAEHKAKCQQACGLPEHHPHDVAPLAPSAILMAISFDRRAVAYAMMP